MRLSNDITNYCIVSNVAYLIKGNMPTEVQVMYSESLYDIWHTAVCQGIRLALYPPRQLSVKEQFVARVRTQDKLLSPSFYSRRHRFTCLTNFLAPRSRVFLE
jgi:hypothetical protein